MEMIFPLWITNILTETKHVLELQLITPTFLTYYHTMA